MSLKTYNICDDWGWYVDIENNNFIKLEPYKYNVNIQKYNNNINQPKFNHFTHLIIKIINFNENKLMVSVLSLTISVNMFIFYYIIN